MNKQDGYILDTIYPVFFYKEIQPLWLNTIFSFLGFKTTDINEKFSYLELGCATGINLIIAAINNPHGDFLGIDFNKKHIEKAKKIASSVGLKNIEFIHCDFFTFLKINNRKFDFIINHGTFSWVSPEVKKDILSIVAQFLNNTGLFYLHYMCYPASASLLSTQKLLSLVDHYTEESSLKSIELGKNLFSELNDAGAFVDNPKIDAIVKTLNQDHSYLAHEFLTDYWQPLYSVDVHQMVFQATQNNYIGSANSIENIDNISIPLKMQNIIKNTQNPALKEYLKDLARNAKQRVDIFQKNPEKLEGDVYLDTIKSVKFNLLPHAPKRGCITFKTAIGDIKAPQEVISPVLELLSKSDANFSELLDFPMFKNNPIFLIETIFLLMNAGYVLPTLNKKYTLDNDIIENFNKFMDSQDIKIKILMNSGIVV